MLSYRDLLSDARLEARADRIAQAMQHKQSVIVHQLADDRAEAAAAYRFFANDNVTEEALKAALVRRCQDRVEAKHYLVIQDTTQLNFDHLADRLGADHGLGVIGDNDSLGCFVHPSLVVDADTEACLGLSEVSLWTRPRERPDKHERDYKRLPIEEKESFRWIESLQASQRPLEAADRLTMVADSESDIFEVAARVPDAKTHFLIRACANRRVREAAGRLYDHVGEQDVATRYELAVRGDGRQPRGKRQAQIAVRYVKAHLQRPDRPGGSDDPEYVPVYVVEAREENPTALAAGEKPICWRLVTSHVIETPDEARQIITWYQKRWYIEQYFRLLKSQGLDLESAQLEHGDALRRLSLVALGAALQIMRLYLVRDEDTTTPASYVFNAPEQRCIEALMPQYEGKTRKQRNPHKVGSLAWCGWLIARLGGWKGYRSQRPPGPITYYRGFYRFANLYQGWKMAQP